MLRDFAQTNTHRSVGSTKNKISKSHRSNQPKQPRSNLFFWLLSLTQKIFGVLLGLFFFLLVIYLMSFWLGSAIFPLTDSKNMVLLLKNHDQAIEKLYFVAAQKNQQRLLAKSFIVQDNPQLFEQLNQLSPDQLVNQQKLLSMNLAIMVDEILLIDQSKLNKQLITQIQSAELDQSTLEKLCWQYFLQQFQNGLEDTASSSESSSDQFSPDQAIQLSQPGFEQKEAILSLYFFIKNASLVVEDDQQQLISTFNQGEKVCSVAVINATSVANLAKDFGQVLENSNFNLIRLGNIDKEFEYSAVYYRADTNCTAWAGKIKQIFFPAQELSNNEQLTNQYRADIVVVLGKDLE